MTHFHNFILRFCMKTLIMYYAVLGVCASACVCMSACARVCVCMSVCVCVCVCVCMLSCNIIPHILTQK
jgi:hypothetical protein